MDLCNNNYYQSDNFKNLNKDIFKYKIVNTLNKKFFILRNRNFMNKNNFYLTKANLGSEFKGILEMFGQTIDLNEPKYFNKIDILLNECLELNKNNNYGMIIFRAFDIEKKEQYDEIVELFKKKNFLCRPWNTPIIHINQINKDNLINRYNTRREVKKIKLQKILIENINSFEEYKLYIKYFFKSFGHQNYPNKTRYYEYLAWENLKILHNFFIIKINKEPYAIFAVRIFKKRAYWCMVGRVKNYKYSLHAFAIDYLFDYLKKKNVDFIDLAGFNPYPKNKKEDNIKKFKNSFNSKIIYQPTFIKDNTIFIKTLRKISNKILKKNTFADEGLF